MLLNKRSNVLFVLQSECLNIFYNLLKNDIKWPALQFTITSSFQFSFIFIVSIIICRNTLQTLTPHYLALPAHSWDLNQVNEEGTQLLDEMVVCLSMWLTKNKRWPSWRKISMTSKTSLHNGSLVRLGYFGLFTGFLGIQLVGLGDKPRECSRWSFYFLPLKTLFQRKSVSFLKTLKQTFNCCHAWVTFWQKCPL